MLLPRTYVFAHPALSEPLTISAISPEHALLVAEELLRFIGYDLLDTVNDGAEITLEEIA